VRPAIKVHAGNDIVFEFLVQFAAGLSLENVETIISGRSRGGFLKNQLPTVIETLQRAGNRECQQQPHQAEDRAFDGGETCGPLRCVMPAISQAEMPPDLQRKQRACEKGHRDADGKKQEDHSRSPITTSIRRRRSTVGWQATRPGIARDANLVNSRQRKRLRDGLGVWGSGGKAVSSARWISGSGRPGHQP